MFMLGLLLLSSAQAQMQLPKVPDVLKGVGGQSSGGLSEPRAADGLKEALRAGTDHAALRNRQRPKPKRFL
jgi:hypothetical protein